MNILRALICLSIIFSFNVYSQKSICDDNRSINELNKLINKSSRTTTNQELANVLEKKLILVGEAHYITNLKYLKELISIFSQQHFKEKACVAFEFSSKHPNFKSFLSELEWLSKKLNKKYQNIDPKDESYEEYIETIEYLDRIKNYYGELHNFAISKELLTFAVDHPENTFTNNIDYESRNIEMAHNIQKLLNTYSCDSILYLTGKAHLSSNQSSTNKIQDYLEQSILENTVTINVQMTNEGLLPKIYRTWNSCDSPKLSEPILFKSNVLSPKLLLAPMSDEPLPFLIDYNYTFLIP